MGGGVVEIRIRLGQKARSVMNNIPGREGNKMASDLPCLVHRSNPSRRLNRKSQLENSSVV